MYHPSTSFRLRRSQSCRSSVWQQPAKIRSQIPNHGIITVPSVVSIGAWDIEGLDPVSPHQTWIETVGKWTWLQFSSHFDHDTITICYDDENWLVTLHITYHIKCSSRFFLNILNGRFESIDTLTTQILSHSPLIVAPPSPPTDTSLGVVAIAALVGR